MGQILYAALLELSTKMLACYDYTISYIRLFTFTLIGKPSKNIPASYDEVLHNSNATDLHSHASFYNHSNAFKRLAIQNGAIPPARMIRPSALLDLNYLKGRVKEFNRALKSLCYTSSSENLIIGVLGRLLVAQVNNAALMLGLSISKRRGLLLDASPHIGTMKKGYSALIHNTARCGTLAGFVRELARCFYVERSKAPAQSGTRFEPGSVPVSQQTEDPLHLLYCKDAAMNYNRPADKQKGLGEIRMPKSVRGRVSFCSLCSYSFTQNLTEE